MDVNEQQEDLSQIADGMKSARAQQKYDEMLGENKAGFAELMLEDDSIPPVLGKYFSVFTHKENALSNITTIAQFERLELELADAINDFYLFTPAEEQTAEMERSFTQMRYKHYLKLCRSMGGKDRERAQWNTVVTRDEKESTPMSGGGVGGKIRGLFR